MSTIDPTIVTAADTTPTSGTTATTTDWFEALAQAWGQTLDAEAQKITDLSNQLSTSSQDPSQYALLTAESQRMSFLANSESTSVNAAGEALQTLARKQ